MRVPKQTKKQTRELKREQATDAGAEAEELQEQEAVVQ
jgi:hypothetical protein